jgi:hypothetical protein
MPVSYGVPEPARNLDCGTHVLGIDGKAGK